MATRMQQRRGTAEQWLLADPVLAAGEIGFETDTGSFKLGDGISHWTDLDYFETTISLQGTLDDYVPLSQKGAPLGVAELDENGFVPASQLDIDVSGDVNAAVSALIGGAPELLDTLNELAAAIGDDANFITTINNSIAQAETDANSYTDGRETAITTAYQAYADTAEADAVTTANAYTDAEILAIPAVDLTGYALEAYVDTAIENVVGLAPETLDTLAELADALGDNPAAITTLQSDVSALQTSKADLIDGFVDPSQLNSIGTLGLPGKFVAVSTSTTAAHSTDGITWTETTIPIASWRSVTYGNDKFVAVGYYSPAAYSTNGITWTASTMPASAAWFSVTHEDGKFVAVAINSSTAAYSTDGITWTASTLPASVSWRSVTYGDGKFVVVAYSSSTAAYSTDGITWTQSTMPASAAWVSVVYGEDKFVAVARSNTTAAAYSTDAITWTLSTLPASAAWFSVTHGGSVAGSSSPIASEDYVDTAISAIPAPDYTGLATETYVDTAEADAVSSANSYTDTEIGTVNTTISNLTTTEISEGTNQYYTDTRARNAVSVGDGLGYDSTTGVFSAGIGYGLKIDANGDIEVDGNFIATDLDVANIIGDATVDGTSGNTVTARIASAVAGIVDTAPEALNTLNELAAALGDDENFATTIAGQIGGKANTVHTHFLADVTDVTATATELNYVDGVTSALQTQLDAKSDSTTVTNSLAEKAPIASPSFTGTVDFSSATVQGLEIPQPLHPFSMIG